jgi:hypothetical protein
MLRMLNTHKIDGLASSGRVQRGIHREDLLEGCDLGLDLLQLSLQDSSMGRKPKSSNAPLAEPN